MGGNRGGWLSGVYKEVVAAGLCVWLSKWGGGFWPKCLKPNYWGSVLGVLLETAVEGNERG